MFHAQIGGDDESERRLVSLEALEGVRQVWLIADARDVALITAPVPPLSGKRLKQALPNVIEEYVLQDPARCLIVPGPVLPSRRPASVSKPSGPVSWCCPGKRASGRCSSRTTT